MNAGIESYFHLFSKFLDGAASAHEFQRAYLDKFKNEEVRFDERIYDLLDALFGDVDAFTDDLELLAENPNYYVSEEVLKDLVSQAARDLRAMVTKN
jgi:Bacterial self-protective colicin-like immunity